MIDWVDFNGKINIIY